MELRSEHLAVLDIFRNLRAGKGQFLLVQVLLREREHLPRKIQKNWDNIIRMLTDSGLILRDPLGYGLTEKGQAHFSRSPSQPDGGQAASSRGEVT